MHECRPLDRHLGLIDVRCDSILPDHASYLLPGLPCTLLVWSTSLTSLIGLFMRREQKLTWGWNPGPALKCASSKLSLFLPAFNNFHFGFQRRPYYVSGIAQLQSCLLFGELSSKWNSWAYLSFVGQWIQRRILRVRLFLCLVIKVLWTKSLCLKGECCSVKGVVLSPRKRKHHLPLVALWSLIILYLTYSLAFAIIYQETWRKHRNENSKSDRHSIPTIARPKPLTTNT